MTQNDYQVFPELQLFETVLGDMNNAINAYPGTFPNPIQMGVTVATPPNADFANLAINWQNYVTNGNCIAHYIVGFTITASSQSPIRAMKMREAFSRNMIGRLNTGKEITVTDGIITNNKKYWLSQYRGQSAQPAVRPFIVQGDHRYIATLFLTSFLTER